MSEQAKRRREVASNVSTPTMAKHTSSAFLRVFTDTLNADGAKIDSFTIWALHDVMTAKPKWPAKGLAWLEALDRVDISDILARARASRDVAPQRYAIATMLTQEIAAAFMLQSAESNNRENIVPIDSDLIYGARAIADWLKMPLPTCRELMNEGSIPTFRMPGSTTRCARKSTLNALWAKYEEQAAQKRA